MKSEFSTSASKSRRGGEKSAADAKVHLTHMNEVGRDTWAAKLTNRSGRKKMETSDRVGDACKIRPAVKHEFPSASSEEDGNGDIRRTSLREQQHH